eukprot:1177288-Prorocentrum_minimum.AAC.1
MKKTRQSVLARPEVRTDCSQLCVGGSILKKPRLRDDVICQFKWGANERGNNPERMGRFVLSRTAIRLSATLASSSSRQ